MSLLASIFLESAAFIGVAIFLLGFLFCYLVLYWRDRDARASLIAKEKSILENARQHAENLAREGRIAANEESLKLRNEAERQFVERRKELASAEKRIIERESLLNQQLENLVQQEKDLRDKAAENQKQAESVEKLRREL